VDGQAPRVSSDCAQPASTEGRRVGSPSSSASRNAQSAIPDPADIDYPLRDRRTGGRVPRPGHVSVGVPQDHHHPLGRPPLEAWWARWQATPRRFRRGRRGLPGTWRRLGTARRRRS